MNTPEDWIYNPHCGLLLTTMLPREKSGLKLTTRALTTELLRLLLKVSEGASLDGLTPAEREELHDLGLALAPDDLPHLVYYSPWLGLDWPQYWPPRAKRLAATGPLQLVTGEAAPIESVPAELLPPQAGQLWLAPTAPCQLRLPFCPAPELRSQLEALQTGMLTLDALSPSLRSLWLTAGLLRSGAGFADPLPAAAESLRTQGYAVLRDMVNPLHLAAWRGYVRGLTRYGYFQPDFTQVEGRLLIHNQPLLQVLHEQLTELLSRMLEQPLQSSYSKLAVYPGGSELLPHYDRPQCRWNASLMLTYEPGDSEPWPFCLKHAGRVHELELEMGDLVIYSGNETIHWRPPLPDRRYAGVGLFHFVKPDFDGSLD